VEAADDLRATKLCTVMADPERNWHNRSGWVVDITYMKLADDRQDSYWSVDALAARVAAAARQGLRVLARKLDAHQQTLPPAQDYIALSDYLAFVRRLATDERLRTIDAFIVGSGPNANSSNQLAPDRLISPEWYARVFNGYGEPVDHQDNVCSTDPARSLAQRKCSCRRRATLDRRPEPCTRRAHRCTVAQLYEYAGVGN